MNDDITRCPGTNRDGEQCGHPAGWGTDGESGPCKFHGGAADNRGEKNGNYEHGAYSEFVDFQRDSLSEREQKAIDAIDFDEHGEEFARDVVREAYAKYLRTGDDRFLREARQWAKDFGVLETPAEQLEVDADVDTDVELDEATRETFRQVLQQRRHEDA